MARKRQPDRPASARRASGTIDALLAKYRAMRDFHLTAEPSGGAAGKMTALPFVVQKHSATRLHYDFRLGWDGVLKSWAVAKGPSYVPKEKRLAVQVEDHPIEYGGFEGTIPKGQYGGGTVLLWDQGTWEPQAGQDVDAGLKAGSLKFILHGKKLKGKWALIRMGGRAANEAKPNWLLIKEHDEFERNADDPEIVDEAPESVATGRGLEAIAKDADHVWSSKGASKDEAARKPSQAPKKDNGRTAPRASGDRLAKPTPTPSTAFDLTAFPREKLPEFIAPQLAVEAAAASDAVGWLHELKLDGYRIQAIKSEKAVRLKTRSGLDWTSRFKAIAKAVAELPSSQAVLDGEIVALDHDGLSNFAFLQASMQAEASHPLTYFVFDLLHLDGHNLRNAQLARRKEVLAQLLAAAADPIRLSEHVEDRGAAMFEGACKLHAEGIISKRSAGTYRSGRWADWIKVKCKREQEFVIGGFTMPSKSNAGIGALLLGYYDDHGRLIYAGRTGTGFTQKIHRMLRQRLEAIKTPTSPFVEVAGVAKRGAIWVRPELVAQVSFATWTADLLVRQASFQGLREDKPAAEVRREVAMDRVARTVATGAAAKAVSGKRNGLAGGKTEVSETGAHAPVALTHPDKLVDAETGLTKQHLADYLWAVAEVMLPEVAGRPLSLVRCPEGSAKPCFFQKHTTSALPKGVESVDVPDKKTGKVEPYITLSSAEALAGLAQMGVLEIHPWGSRNEDLEHPDRIIFDLDPDEAIEWSTLAKSADEIRRLLASRGLESFLKSTGGKGLHVVAPIRPEHVWQEVKGWCHDLALELEKKNPSLYLTKMSKVARKGRIFVDYLRNDRGATAVAAYSPRARSGAPVALPLEWDELRLKQRPVFHVMDFDDWKPRLKEASWQRMRTVTQSLKLQAAKAR